MAISGIVPSIWEVAIVKFVYTCLPGEFLPSSWVVVGVDTRSKLQIATVFSSKRCYIVFFIQIWWGVPLVHELGNYLLTISILKFLCRSVALTFLVDYLFNLYRGLPFQPFASIFHAILIKLADFSIDALIGN